MDYSLKEEIEKSIDNALEKVGASYTIGFEPSQSDGQNACFTIMFSEETRYDDLDNDVEVAIKDSGLLSEFDLYFFWDDGDLCICTDGWD